jgi:L-lactate dehydrogenase complex protein LldG
MSAREQILGQIRRSLGRDGPIEGEALNRAEERLREPPRGLIPERSQKAAADLALLFVEKAQKANCTVEEVGSLRQVPDAIATYLTQENLPAEVRMGEHPDLLAIPFEQRPTLTVTKGRTDGTHAVSLAAAFAGAAETGTLALLSGPEGPTSLNFLPESEIVILRKSKIVGPYEDIWQMLRARTAQTGSMPRTVNFITGPSRTGDIEQKIELGAHGPLRLHIVIIDDL